MSDEKEAQMMTKSIAAVVAQYAKDLQELQRKAGPKGQNSPMFWTEKMKLHKQLLKNLENL